MSLSKKQEALKQEKIVISQRLEHEKWMKQFYEDKKV